MRDEDKTVNDQQTAADEAKPASADVEDGFDDSDGFDDDEIVSFTDEDGTERSCLVLAVVEHGGSEFAMLAPVEQLRDETGDDLELFLFRYEIDDDDTEMFSYINDERTYAAVQKLCEGLLG